MSRLQSRCIFYCYDWILEFQAYEMWRVLKKESPECSSAALLSAATGFIEQMTVMCDTRKLPRIKEVIFVSLTSLLIKLRDHSGELDSNTEDHIFTTIPKMVEDLIGFCTGCQSVSDLGTEACLETNILNIYTLCRRGQYDLAQKVFEEVTDEIDKGTNQRISAILNATNKPHRFLQENSISDYMETMTRFLEAVLVYNNTKPTILKFAELLANGDKQEYRGAKCVYEPQTEPLLQTDMNPVNEEDMESKCKKAQQKFQTKFFQRVYTDPAADVFNSSDDEEENMSMNSHTSGGTRAQVKDRSSACTPRKDHGEEDNEESVSRRRERGKRLVRKRQHSPTTYQKENRSSPCTPPQKDRGHDSRPNLSPRRSVAWPATLRPSELVSDSELESEESDPHGSEKTRRLDRKRQHSPTTRQDVSPELSSDTTDDDGGRYNRNLESRVGPLNRQPLYRHRPPRQVKPPSHNKPYEGRKKWTYRETEDFYLAVQKFGVGNWGKVHQALKTDRNNVQLKDKWRNIIQHDYDKLRKRFGPVS